jgi:hypothetical protein
MAHHRKLNLSMFRDDEDEDDLVIAAKPKVGLHFPGK